MDMCSNGNFSEFINQTLSKQEISWIKESSEMTKEGLNNTKFYLRFGRVYRHIQLKAVPEHVSTVFKNTHELVRFYLLTYAGTSPDQEVLEKLFDTGNTSETITLYKSLQYLESPEKYVHRVTEGIRTNILEVYDAIAYSNSFPAQYLPELAFNQLVLKGIFNERPIYLIEGLEKRLNDELALTAYDYIHERWSAGRKVTSEIWLLLTPILSEKHTDFLTKGIQSGDELQSKAIQLAIVDSKNQNLIENINANHPGITWNEIGEQIHTNNRQ